jgi:predicted ATPase
MLQTFRVQNFKALRDLTLHLTPVHVLIGPNDSGKTSILEALCAYSRMPLENPLTHAFQGRWRGHELVWRGDREGEIAFTGDFTEDAQPLLRHEIWCRFFEEGQQVVVAGESFAREGRQEIRLPRGKQAPTSALFPFGGQAADADVQLVRDGLQPTRLYRWIPRHLALPVSYGFAPSFRMEPTGFGLAMFLNDILLDDPERYAALQARFRKLFPSVDRIHLRRGEAYGSPLPEQPATTSGIGIYFEQAAPGHLVPASQASDGMLLALAYLALLYSPQSPRIILLEEPENGVHPQRLRQVLGILKELVGEQGRTQVLLTTHSPYVVDCFQPEQVTLCLKGPDGAVTTHRLSESKAVRQQMDIFRLGEIWTAEGDEALAAPSEVQPVGAP